MPRRSFLFLAAFWSLLAPLRLAAQTNVPLTKAGAKPPLAPQTSAPLNLADLQWQRIALHHTTTNRILTLMHWDTAPHVPLRADNNLFPEGVDAVNALPQENVLLVHATPGGFDQIKQLIRILDIGPRGWEPTISFLSVPICEPDLPQRDGQQSPWKLSSGAAVTQKFHQLTHSGHTPVTVKPDNEYEPQPLEWIVSGYCLSALRLNSDDSLTLNVFPVLLGNSASKRIRVRRGESLAVWTTGRLQTIFLKIDY